MRKVIIKLEAIFVVMMMLLTVASATGIQAGARSKRVPIRVSETRGEVSWIPASKEAVKKIRKKIVVKKHEGVLKATRKESPNNTHSKHQSTTRYTSKGQPANATQAEQMFYDFAKSKGLDDLHIAAILGDYSLEARMDPTNVETILDERYRIGPKKIAAEELNFDMDAMNHAYAAKYPAIIKAGIGFGAWTDTVGMGSEGAATLLRKYANERGTNWYDMNTQLEYWWSGPSKMPDLGYIHWHGRAKFEAAKDITEATEVYHCMHVAGWNVNPKTAYAHHKLANRVANAKSYYKMIQNGYYD